MVDLIALLLAVLLGLGPSAGSGSEIAEPVPATPVPTVHVERVVLEVGHCWIEPVEVDGRRWGVPRRHQIGWGGGLPRGWIGGGRVTVRSPQRATYLDDGGSTVPLRPAGHPSVDLRGQVCR